MTDKERLTGSQVRRTVFAQSAACAKSVQARDGAKVTPESADYRPSDSVETPGTDTVRCSKCRADFQPTDKGRCPRCGCWLPGNVGALVHGGRRLQKGHETSLDTHHKIQLRDAVIADKGGRENVSAALASLIDDFACAVVLRHTAFAHLEAVGPLTRAGRRRAVVDLYLQASARAERLASQIGMTRQPQKVDDIRNWLAVREAKP